MGCLAVELVVSLCVWTYSSWGRSARAHIQVFGGLTPVQCLCCGSVLTEKGESSLAGSTGAPGNFDLLRLHRETVLERLAQSSDCAPLGAASDLLSE